MNNIKIALLILGVASMSWSCNNMTKPESNQIETKEQPAPIPLAYKPVYSSSFIIGNPAYAAMIVKGGWKDWDENQLDSLNTWVSDSITAYFSDNTSVHGIDSLIARWKRYRSWYRS